MLQVKTGGNDGSCLGCQGCITPVFINEGEHTYTLTQHCSQGSLLWPSDQHPFCSMHCALSAYVYTTFILHCMGWITAWMAARVVSQENPTLLHYWTQQRTM